MTIAIDCQIPNLTSDYWVCFLASTNQGFRLQGSLQLIDKFPEYLGNYFYYKYFRNEIYLSSIFQVNCLVNEP